VVAKVRQRLSVSKRLVQKFDMERFNLKKLNDMKVGEECQLKISNKFAALESQEEEEEDDDDDDDDNDDDDDVDISRSWESVRENMTQTTLVIMNWNSINQGFMTKA